MNVNHEIEGRAVQHPEQHANVHSSSWIPKFSFSSLILKQSEIKGNLWWKFKVLNPEESVWCYIETLSFSIFDNLKMTYEDNSLLRYNRLILSVTKIQPEIDAVIWPNSTSQRQQHVSSLKQRNWNIKLKNSLRILIYYAQKFQMANPTKLLSKVADAATLDV